MIDKGTILQNTDRVLKETDFAGLGEKKTGKVRDVYIQKDKIILISTDRHSSFDRIVAHVPFKVQVLNQISVFWFNATKDIIPNHVLAVPDPNVLVAKKYRKHRRGPTPRGCQKNGTSRSPPCFQKLRGPKTGRRKDRGGRWKAPD